nr:unnamed protein product [Callosobruchus chinensis]
MAAGISALAIPLNEQYVITRQIRFDSCPIDDFLFGKSFPDQLKSSKETQRLGYTIKKQQKVAHFMSPKTDITKKTIPVSHEKGGGEISLQGSIGSPIGTLPEDPAQTIHLTSDVAKPFPGGWNFIREAFHRRRVPTVGLQSIQSSLSPSTLKQYTAYLKKWWDFCATRQHSPFQYSLNLILTFLSIQFQNGASYATINSQHAAIVLIFPVKNSDKIIFKRFLKGIYNQKPSMPKYQATWDPHPVLLHLARLYPLEEISRLQLTMKLVTLLALITGHRLQTLTSIRLQNIVRFPDRLEIRISDRIKTSSSKSSQPFLVIPYFKDNPALCLASVVDYYELVINYELITKDLRPSDIDYLILTVKRPIRQVSSQRLSNWIEQTLAASGIDTTDFTIDPWQTILHFLLKES